MLEVTQNPDTLGGPFMSTTPQPPPAAPDPAFDQTDPALWEIARPGRSYTIPLHGLQASAI
jgi:hypothetical protein